MAFRKLNKTSKGALFTLSLVAVLLLSVYVATGYNFNLGSYAFRSRYTATGTLVYASDSKCNLGTHAIIRSTGKCLSVVTSTADRFIGSQVRAEGEYRNNILYATRIDPVRGVEIPVVTGRPDGRPTVAPRPVRTDAPGREDEDGPSVQPTAPGGTSYPDVPNPRYRY